MPFLGVVFNLEAIRKLAERELSPEEVPTCSAPNPS
jgi:hypothetical protein